ncbi:Rotundifolia-like protein [Quillaja saponaria]|uniref:Rotundifolia-like protein n=1 Tax=Quillaja saponaria TaxID=32244 RepID=A0AAD7LUI0_QUISA|nr:Rotundifolia-like protein [Quillaja saponaria]
MEVKVLQRESQFSRFFHPWLLFLLVPLLVLLLHFTLTEKWKLSKKEGSSRSLSSNSPLIKNSSHRRCAFTRKCAKLVKEQRARFYIMRRCVTMLICWRDYSDS